MSSKLARGIIGNGLAQITLKVIRVLEQLLLIPFFLSAWGAAYYGEWITLSIIPTVLAFSNFGFGTAAGNSFVLAYTGDDKQKAADINKNGILVIFGSIVIGVVIIAATLFGGKYFHLFDKSLISEYDAIVSVLLLMIARLLTFYHQLIESYFRAARRASLGNFIYSGCSATNLIVGFCVLSFNGTVVHYAFSQFIVVFLFTIIYYKIGRTMVCFCNYKGRISFVEVKHIALKGIGYMMDPVWQSIYFQGSIFVIRLTLGAESVAIFNTIRTACRSVSQVFSIVIASVFPELQYEYGKGNIPMVHRLFRLSVLTSIAIGIVGTILLSLFGLEIYNLWTQSKLIVSNGIWNTFVIGILLNSVWWTGIIVYSVTNKPYSLAVISIITACFSVIASYLLSIKFGLWGAVFGSILFELMMLFYVLPDSCTLLGMKVRDIFSYLKEDYAFIKRKIFSIKNQ